MSETITKKNVEDYFRAMLLPLSCEDFKREERPEVVLKTIRDLIAKTPYFEVSDNLDSQQAQLHGHGQALTLYFSDSYSRSESLVCEIKASWRSEKITVTVYSGHVQAGPSSDRSFKWNDLTVDVSPFEEHLIAVLSGLARFTVREQFDENVQTYLQQRP